MPFWKKKTVAKEVEKIPTDIREIIEKRRENTIETTDVELVVDDNQVNRDVLCRYLKKYKYNTSQANNGFEALQRIASKNYHIIWIDVNMPIMDGIEATKYLRAEYPDGLGYKGFIIGVTGYADDESRKQCLAAGMNNVLTKPYAGDHISRLHQHPFFGNQSSNN